MKRKYLLMMLLYVTCSLNVMAQTAYYYYQGKKIPLTLNADKVCVSVPKNSEKAGKSILAGIEVLNTINDDAFDIFVVTRSDFEKLSSRESWKEDAKRVIQTSCYLTERNDEVYETPYLNVRLNKEQDADLLAQYAEMYGLRIVRSIPLMPLWYILSVTQYSGKKPLACANELWESGKFAASEPDLAAANNLDLTAGGRAAIVRTEESSDIYDLSGRRQSTEPAKGVYILRGQKVLAK